jgi:hypothetical protein
VRCSERCEVWREIDASGVLMLRDETGEEKRRGVKE